MGRRRGRQSRAIGGGGPRATGLDPRAAATERVRFVPDQDGSQGWTVLIDGVPSSHVDLSDPTRLDFEYMRWIADLLDVAWPSRQAVRAVHVGGAGCSLAHYLRATRPRSWQVVLEVDDEVLAAVKAGFGWRSIPGLRLRRGDGRSGLEPFPDAGLDVLVRDAFVADEVPPHLRTHQFCALAARVLGDGGIYLANLADRPPLAQARREVASALTAFRHVALAAEPAQFSGRRYGNLVLAASAAPLPEAAWGRRLATGAVRARLVGSQEIRAFVAGARPFEDPVLPPS